MATSDNSIREFVQGQYAVLLLDHVAEFKSDFIRIVFEDALLGTVLDNPSPFQKRLADFFTTLDGNDLIQKFETWQTVLQKRTRIEPDFKREKQLLEALPDLTDTCVAEFRKNWFKEASNNEQQARQLAKGFVHDEWFRRQVIPIHHDKDDSKANDYLKKPSLGWLFQSMLFLTTPQRSEEETNHGELHLVLPQLLENTEAVSGRKNLEFERCFPVKIRESFALGSAFLTTLTTALKLDGNRLNAECPPVFSVGRTQGKNGKVGVLTGLTTLFYETSTSTGDDDFSETFAALSHLFGNCNCIQFLPRPQEKKHFGFFQLQSCVPGLVHAIWPALVGNGEDSEFPPARTDSSVESDEHTQCISSPDGRNVVIELPLNWFEGWWASKRFSNIAERDRPAQITNRIRHYHNAWPDKLWAGFERLQSLSVATAAHVEDLAKAEVFRKSHQMLERLETPLRELTRSLDIVQSRTQDLRSVIYEPEEGLFGSYPLIKDLFTDDEYLKLSEHVRIKLSHQLEYDGEVCNDLCPDKRRTAKCKLDGRTVWAVALCRMFGVEKDAFHEAASREEIILTAKQKLLDKSKNPLWEAIRFICNPEQAYRAVDTIDASFIASLLDHEPKYCLQRLKSCSFDPFKLHSDKWALVALALALRRYGLNPSSINLGWQNDLGMQSDWTPVRYSSILGFLIRLSASLSSSAGKQAELVLKVDGMNSERTTDRELCVYYKNGVIDTSRAKRTVKGLRLFVNDHILQMPRDWRIEASTVGNFQQPFYELASNILGLEMTGVKSSSSGKWRVTKHGSLKSSNGHHEIMKLTSAERVFVVEVAESNTLGGVSFKWLPKPQKRKRTTE